MRLVALFLTLLLAAPAGQWVFPLHAPPATSSSPCSGLPTPTLQLDSTTPTGSSGSTVSFWLDGSGSNDKIDFSADASPPTLSGTTPNGTQAVYFGPSGAPGLIETSAGKATTLTNNSQITVVAVYELEDPSAIQALTSNSGASGAFAYYVADGGVQAANEDYLAGIGQGTNAAPSTWQTSAVVFNQGVAINFYRWSASQSGVDATASGSNPSAPLTQGINQVFADYDSTYTLHEAYVAAVRIYDGTALTSAQVGAVHACLASTLGVS